MNYFLECLRKYAIFDGRSRRKEFWIFTLVIITISIIKNIFDSAIINLLAGICWLFLMVPWFAVSVRRLHDTNRSGLWYFINLIPLVGQIIFFIFVSQDSQSGDNKYGPNPKEAN
jgi:uncharacterized membrane protein YhaH (DUF805 family)